GTHYATLAESPALIERFGELAGRQLVSGGQLVSRELLSRVRGSLFSAFDGQLTRLEGLVVMRAQPAGMNAQQSEAAALFESGLIAGLSAVGVPAVGVELRGTEASQIPWYKEKGISSVDDLDALAGQTALVYALAGDHGTFGAKATADSLLPTLTSSTTQP
nr:copper transporter [Solirubrobacterales bacterium]